MEKIELKDAFAEFKNQKNIDRPTMMGVLEDVFRTQITKTYGSADNFDIIINIDKGDCEIYWNREVVEEVTDPNTEILSYNYLKVDGGIARRGAAVTKLKREDGKISVVFCGSPDAAFNYMEGFSFLNETRKAQLVSLLREAGALPVYAVGDAEICMRAGYLADGSLFVFALPLGVDPSDTLTLSLEKEPAKIVAISPDGEEVSVAFEKKAKGEYELFVRMEVLYPVALKIAF